MTLTGGSTLSDVFDADASGRGLARVTVLAAVASAHGIVFRGAHLGVRPAYSVVAAAGAGIVHAKLIPSGTIVVVPAPSKFGRFAAGVAAARAFAAGLFVVWTVSFVLRAALGITVFVAVEIGRGRGVAVVRLASLTVSLDIDQLVGAEELGDEATDAAVRGGDDHGDGEGDQRESLHGWWLLLMISV